MTANQDRMSPEGALPPWAAIPFREFSDHHKQASRLLDLTMTGIAMVRGAPKAIDLVASIDRVLEPDVSPDADELKERLANAQSMADLAESEVERGFPVLHEQAIISLWGSLEALINAVVAAWLFNKPEYFKARELEKLKVQLGDYMNLTQIEQCEYAVQLLDQQEGGRRRHGVTRFEFLLAPVGLAGPVESEIGKTVFELEQVRHVLIHRRGLADRRFVEACPWLGVEPGRRLEINHPAYCRMSAAVFEYVLAIVQRARGQFAARAI